MSLIHTKKKSIIKPPFGALDLDPSFHKRGHFFECLIEENNLVDRNIGASIPINDSIWEIGPYGTELNFRGGGFNDYVDCDSISDIFTQDSGCIWIALVNRDNTTNNREYVTSFLNTTTSKRYVFTNASGQLCYGWENTTTINTTIPVPLQTLSVASLQWDSSEGAVFFNGKKVAEQSAPSGTSALNALGIAAWCGNYGSGTLRGDFELVSVRFLSKPISYAEQKSWAENVWDIYREKNRIYIPDGAISLVIQNVSQSQSVDNIDLTQHNSLVVDDASQAQSVDGVVLIQHNSLDVDGANQTQSVDNISLTQHNVLVVNDASQSQSVENVVLTVDGQLEINSASQSQSADNISLTQHHSLVVDGTNQAQSVDTIALTQHGILVIDGASQSQSVDNVVLVPVSGLVIQDVDQDQFVDLINLVSSSSLVIASLSQIQNVDELFFTQHNVLVVDDIFQTQTVQNVNIGSLFGVVGGKFIVVSPIGGGISVLDPIGGESGIIVPESEE